MRPYQRGRASHLGLSVVIRGVIETGRLVGVARCGLIGERKSQTAARDKLEIGGPCLRTLGRAPGWLSRIRAVRIGSHPVRTPFCGLTRLLGTQAAPDSRTRGTHHLGTPAKPGLTLPSKSDSLSLCGRLSSLQHHPRELPNHPGPGAPKFFTYQKLFAWSPEMISGEDHDGRVSGIP